MKLPDNLPPLPEGTKYGGQLKDYDGEVVCAIWYEGRPFGWSSGAIWAGMKQEPDAESANWHVALPIETVRDQPAERPKHGAA